MVNRDLIFIIWFGFIKWRTTKDMMEGKNVIGYVNKRSAARYHMEHRLLLWNIILWKTYGSNCSQ